MLNQTTTYKIFIQAHLWRYVLSGLVFLAFFQHAPTLLADTSLANTETVSSNIQYQLNPGDILAINVVNEEAFNLPQLLVQPDGYISLPLIGSLPAAGLTLNRLQSAIKLKLKTLLKDDPIMSLTLIQMSGNTVFVLGKVNRPGAYIMSRPLDVTQALALAGGLATWADEDSVKVLRRNTQGEQNALKFDYEGVKKGRNLKSNILLQSGDVVLVP